LAGQGNNNQDCSAKRSQRSSLLDKSLIPARVAFAAPRYQAHQGGERISLRAQQPSIPPDCHGRWMVGVGARVGDGVPGIWPPGVGCPARGRAPRIPAISRTAAAREGLDMDAPDVGLPVQWLGDSPVTIALAFPSFKALTLFEYRFWKISSVPLVLALNLDFIAISYTCEAGTVCFAFTGPNYCVERYSFALLVLAFVPTLVLQQHLCGELVNTHYKC